jgi:hypothetical protein
MHTYTASFAMHFKVGRLKTLQFFLRWLSTFFKLILSLYMEAIVYYLTTTSFVGFRSGSSMSVGTLSSEIEAFKGLLQVQAFHQGHDF